MTLSTAQGVVQLLIRRTVLSARARVLARPGPASRAALPGLGVAAVARCPARLDLAGGWTDTPPICYELGGKVVDLAIRVDGQNTAEIISNDDYIVKKYL